MDLEEGEEVEVITAPAAVRPQSDRRAEPGARAAEPQRPFTSSSRAIDAHGIHARPSPPSALTQTAHGVEGGRLRDTGVVNAPWQGRGRDSNSSGTRVAPGYPVAGTSDRPAQMLRRGQPVSAPPVSSPQSPKRLQPVLGQQPTAWDRTTQPHPFRPGNQGPGGREVQHSADRAARSSNGVQSALPHQRRPLEPQPPRESSAAMSRGEPGPRLNPAERDAADLRPAGSPSTSSSMHGMPRTGSVYGARAVGVAGPGGGPQQQQQQQQQLLQPNRAHQVPAYGGPGAGSLQQRPAGLMPSPSAAAGHARAPPPAYPEHPASAMLSASSPPTPVRMNSGGSSGTARGGDDTRMADNRRFPSDPAPQQQQQQQQQRSAGSQAGETQGPNVSDETGIAWPRQKSSFVGGVLQRASSGVVAPAPDSGDGSAAFARQKHSGRPQQQHQHQQQRPHDVSQQQRQPGPGDVARSGAPPRPILPRPAHAAAPPRGSSGLLGSAPVPPREAVPPPQRQGLLSQPSIGQKTSAEAATAQAWQPRMRHGDAPMMMGGQRPLLPPPPQVRKVYARAIMPDPHAPYTEPLQNRQTSSLLGRGDSSFPNMPPRPMLTSQQTWSIPQGPFPLSQPSLLRGGDPHALHQPRPVGASLLQPPPGFQPTAQGSRMMMGGGGSVLGRFPGAGSSFPAPHEVNVRAGILGRLPTFIRSPEKHAWEAPTMPPQHGAPWGLRQHHLMMQPFQAGFSAAPAQEQLHGFGNDLTNHAGMEEPTDPADELPLLPEGDAGAAGRALRLEADDGETKSPTDDIEMEEEAIVQGEVSKKRAKRFSRTSVRDEESPKKADLPPVIVAIGDGSFIPSSFAATLSPLLEAFGTPASASTGVVPLVASLPPMQRAVSAPQPAHEGALSAGSASVHASAGIAAALLAEAQVDITVSATTASLLPSTITKDRIIAAMEALEAFAVRATDGIAAVEAAAPGLRLRAAELRSTLTKQQQSAAEAKQRHAAATEAANAAAAAAAASAAAAVRTAAAVSASRSPTLVFRSCDLLLSASTPSLISQLAPSASDLVVSAASHLLSLLSVWSANPLWITQLSDASSAAAVRLSKAALNSSARPPTRTELAGDAVLSGRLWRLLGSAHRSTVADLRILLKPACSEPSERLADSGLAIKISHTLPANVLFDPADPSILGLSSGFVLGSVSPAYALHQLPTTFPSRALVVAFSSDYPSSSESSLFATIASSSEENALFCSFDAECNLPPALRRKKTEVSASSLPMTPLLSLSVESLTAHREVWADACATRRTIILGNRARAWASQAEQSRLRPTSPGLGYSSSPSNVTPHEIVSWATGLQRDGDDFSVPLPAFSRVGKSAESTKVAVASSRGAPVRLMRSAVVEALRSKFLSAMDTEGDFELGADSATRINAMPAPLALRNPPCIPDSSETAILSWRANRSSEIVNQYRFAACADELIGFISALASQCRSHGSSSVQSVSLRLATERLLHLHLRGHVESALLFRRASLRAQQKAAAIAFVAAYREWKAKRMRQARLRRIRIQHAHARLAVEHFGGGGGGQSQTAPVAQLPRFATERSGGRRAAALVAAVAIASTGTGATEAGSSKGAAPSVIAVPASPSSSLLRHKQKHGHQQHGALSPHVARLDAMTDATDDLASDSGDDAFALNRLGGSGDHVRSELELQQRLSEIAERERRLEFRLYSLCPLPDRLPDFRTRAFWTRVHYSTGSRLTTDGAPPLCAGLPAGVPCSVVRPTPLQLARVLAAAADSSSPSSPLLLGSADDSRVFAELLNEAAGPDAPGATSIAGDRGAGIPVVSTGTFEPNSGDNVPPPRRRLWMGRCNCAVAVEIERRAVNPWTDAEKLLFMDKFMQFPKDFPRIASFLPNKSAGDCVAFYYDTKHVAGYKHRLKAINTAQRRRAPRNQWLQACGAARDVGVPLHLDIVRGYSAAGRIISAIGRSGDLAFSRLFVHPGPYARVHALHRFVTLPLPLLPPTLSKGASTGGSAAASVGPCSGSLEQAVAIGADPGSRRNEYMYGYGTGASSLPWGSRFSTIAGTAERAGADAGAIDTLALVPSAPATGAGAGAGVGASLVRVYMGADALTRSEGGGRGGAGGVGSPKAGSGGSTAALLARHACWSGVFSLDRPSELVPPSALPLAWTSLGGVGSGPAASTAAAFPLSPASTSALAASVLLAAVASVSPRDLVLGGLQEAAPCTDDEAEESGSDDEAASGRRRDDAVALKRLVAILRGEQMPPDASVGRAPGGGGKAAAAKLPHASRRGGTNAKGNAATSHAAAAVAAPPAVLTPPPRWSLGLARAWLKLLARCLPLALLPGTIASDPRATGFLWQLITALDGVTGTGAVRSAAPAALSVGVAGCEESAAPAVADEPPAALRGFYADAARSVASVLSSAALAGGSHLAACAHLASELLPFLVQAGAGGRRVAASASPLSLVIRDLGTSLLLSAAEASLASFQQQTRLHAGASAGGPAASPRPGFSVPPSPLPSRGSSAPSTPQTLARTDSVPPSSAPAAAALLADKASDVVAAYAASVAIFESQPAAAPVRGGGAAAAAAADAKASGSVANGALLAATVGPFVAPILQQQAAAAPAPGRAPPAADAASFDAASPAAPWLPPAMVTLRYFDPLRAMHASVSAGDTAGVPSAQLSAAFPRRELDALVVPPTAAEDFVRRRLPALARAYAAQAGSDDEDAAPPSRAAAAKGGRRKAARLDAAAAPAPEAAAAVAAVEAAGAAPPPAPQSALLEELLHLPPVAGAPRSFRSVEVAPDGRPPRDGGYVCGLVAPEAAPEADAAFAGGGGGGAPAAKKRPSSAPASAVVAALPVVAASIILPPSPQQQQPQPLQQGSEGEGPPPASGAPPAALEGDDPAAYPGTPAAPAPDDDARGGDCVGEEEGARREYSAHGAAPPLQPGEADDDAEAPPETVGGAPSDARLQPAGTYSDGEDSVSSSSSASVASGPSFRRLHVDDDGGGGEGESDSEGGDDERAESGYAGLAADVAEEDVFDDGLAEEQEGYGAAPPEAAAGTKRRRRSADAPTQDDGEEEEEEGGGGEADEGLGSGLSDDELEPHSGTPRDAAAGGGYGGSPGVEWDEPLDEGGSVDYADGCGSEIGGGGDAHESAPLGYEPQAYEGTATELEEVSAPQAASGVPPDVASGVPEAVRAAAHHAASTGFGFARFTPGPEP